MVDNVLRYKLQAIFGAVLHGALNIVYADIVAKYGTGVGVLQFDGRSSKTDERGVARQ
jgi:hypothetical protein